MPQIDIAAGEESKTFSLAKVQAWVRGVESLLGPIVKIGHDEDETAGTFDNRNPENPRSKIRSIVKITITGNAPAGTKKLCDGWVFVSGAIQRVIVYRPAGEDGSA